MFSVNPARQIATANVHINQGQQSFVTAEQNMQQVVSGGPGFAGAARHALFLAKQLISFGREKFRSWILQAKDEQEAMRQLRLGDNKDVATA
jgi:hypothetical protein